VKIRILGLAAVLFTVAVWTAWPERARPAPDVPSAIASGAAPAPGPAPQPIAAAEAIETPPPVAAEVAPLPEPERAAVPTGPVSLRVLAAVETPGFGFARLLRRPEFAPRVRFDEELWKAFVDGPRGDLAALSLAVFDRLARLGYESVVERPWRAAVPFEIDADTVGDSTVVVALSARAVGHARLTPGADMIDVQTFGAAEVRSTEPGDLWVWSDSGFPGPHRAGPGRLVPAARTCAVQIERSPELYVRFFPAAWVLAGRSEVLTTVPKVTDRRLRVDGALYLSPAPPPVPDEHLLLSLSEPEAPATVTVREEGDPWGCYVERAERASPRVVARAGH